ncbi:MAG: pyridoxal-phosphate dependent enzyme [Acidimicrobiales bacterium]
MSAPLRLPTGLALVCSACGAASDDPLAFRCAAARPGDDIDHVLSPPEPPLDAWADDAPAEDADPFVRYRTMLHAYRLHRAWGGAEAGYLALVEELQAAIDRLDGRRFRTTPLHPVPAAALLGTAGAAGRVWVKDETVNPSGSHKGRHLFGLALHLRVVAAARARGGAADTGRADETRPRLAISSCGNAALAAAVVAAAAGYPLEVFVPPDAAASVLQRLDGLGAAITVCPRAPGERGDPCFTRFLEAVGAGALPFAAQGPQNGLTLDGAATLGYELADQLRAAGAAPAVLAVQVGGGALGASVALGLRRAVERGRLDRLPALHGVQTTGAAPLERADRLVHAAAAAAGSFEAALAHAARHRSSVMWPWEQPPHSIAGGILDDETYDWRALVDAMHASGGGPVVVTEEQLARANELGRAATGIDADHTGTAGLAGLLALAAAGRLAPSGDAVVLFTGQRR